MIDKKVSRVAFLVSLSGHLLFFALPGFNLDASQVQKPEDISIVLRMEIPPLLPEIKVMGEEKKLKAEDREQKTEDREEQEPQPDSKPEPKPQPEEIVVDAPPEEHRKERVEVIDTREEAMLRYQDMIKQRIEAHRRFPRWARERGFEGTVHLSFIVLVDGQAQDINVVHSSGFNILDDEAVSTVRRASPFSPIPPALNLSRLAIEVAIVFML